MESLTRAHKLFNELSFALVNSRFVTITNPGKDRTDFPKTQMPVALVKMDDAAKATTYALVGDFAERNGLYTITRGGVAGGDSEILVYINEGNPKPVLTEKEREKEREAILQSNAEIRAARKKIAESMGVRVNDVGTEFYGMRESDGVAWMCVFKEHSTCVASDCGCNCHR